jgi:hypothetical protein
VLWNVLASWSHHPQNKWPQNKWPQKKSTVRPKAGLHSGLHSGPRSPRQSTRPLTWRELPTWILAWTFVILSASDFHPLWIFETPVEQISISSESDQLLMTGREALKKLDQLFCQLNPIHRAEKRRS